MTWMHCLNCGWQGANNAGKSEKLAGGLMLAAGVVVLVAVKTVPTWIGIVGIVLGAITLLLGVGAVAAMQCPHCTSKDIRRFKSSLDSHQGSSSVPD